MCIYYIYVYVYIYIHLFSDKAMQLDLRRFYHDTTENRTWFATGLMGRFLFFPVYPPTHHNSSIISYPHVVL